MGRKKVSGEVSRFPTSGLCSTRLRQGRGFRISFKDQGQIAPHNFLAQGWAGRSASVEKYLTNASTLYWQTAELDAGTREAAARYYQRLFDGLAELLLARRDQVSHPQPELAIRFAVEWMDATLTERLLLRTDRLNQITMTDEELVHELTRALACYLGIPYPA